MARRVDLVIIDPQNSFCEVVPMTEQQVKHTGELCVPGAWDDMVRVSNMIQRLGKKVNRIHVTLDSHHQWHIAHPCWFKDSKGNNPAPFTSMRLEKDNIIGSQFVNGKPVDVGEYTPSLFGTDYKWTYEYLAELEKNKRYSHMIWPLHCLIGSPGHNIVAPLFDALLNWETSCRQTVNKITKGSCRHVEHFSAVRAEVIHPADPSTQLNTDFVQTLSESDEILLCGEALNFCLANTARDIATELGPDFVKKCVLLSDGSSNVTGLEFLGDQFIKDMTAMGMQISTTKDYLK